MKIEGKSLLIFGSRTLKDKRVEAEIEKFVAAGNYKYIITALDPGGVCERVKHYAKTSRRGLVLIQVGLDKTRARGMWAARSTEAMKMADHMLAIWDGASKGTAGEIRLAEKMGVPMTTVRLEMVKTESTVDDLGMGSLELTETVDSLGRLLSRTL